MALVNWECEHEQVVAHWELTSGSRGYICSPTPTHLDEVAFCDGCQMLASECNHEGPHTVLYRRRKGRA